MKIFKLLLIFSIIIVFNGCTNLIDPIINSEIEPHTVGNSWTYRLTVRRNSDNTIIQKKTGTTILLNRTIFGNESWYGVGYPPEPPSLFHVNRKDGLWVNGVQSGKGEILAIYPSKVGKHYLLQSTDTSQHYLVTESINRKVRVQAGEFSCYVYSYISIINNKINCTCSQKSYYSPGIGMVKYEMISDNSRIIYELIDYTIK